MNEFDEFMNGIQKEDEMNKMSLKDKYYLLKNQSKIGNECIKNGYAIIRMPSGKLYKIKELG